MNDEAAFRRISAFTAILSAPVALASWVAVAFAVDFHFDRVADPADIITLGPRGAGFFHAAWAIADTFGYLLLLVPVALYLWWWLKPHSPHLVTLYTVFGLAFIFIGAISVSILGGAVPPMMRAYAEAAGPQRDMLLVTFQAVMDFAFDGLGALAWFLGGLWWLGTGIVLRNERRALGIVTVILGILTLVYSGAGFLRFDRMEPFATLELFVLLLAPMWALWLGIVVLRGAGATQQADRVLPLRKVQPEPGGVRRVAAAG